MTTRRATTIHGAVLAALLLLLASPALAARGGNGGGGGGGDTGATIRYDYEALPAPAAGAGALDISENRDWVGGWSIQAHSCQTQAQGPAVWERDASLGWLRHELPGVNGVAKGYVMKVLADGTAVGREQVYSTDCATSVVRPRLWEPAGAGVWTPLDLPAPPEGTTVANHAADVAGVGRVIVGGAADGGMQMWRQVAGEWTRQSLGTLDESAAAYGVSSSGVVVGGSWTASGLDVRPVVVVPEDADLDGAPDTWFRDDDADGVNDLLQPLGPSGRALDVNATPIAVGHAPLATAWEPGVGGDWSETTLPVGDFSVGTDAQALSDAGQVVGEGTRPKGRSREQRALLWERDEFGSWALTDLNDVTELPSGTTLNVGRSINACGDIVGHAQTRDAGPVFLLTPRASACD